jgi:PqqD family protein of HPr-rel-A system
MHPVTLSGLHVRTVGDDVLVHDEAGGRVHVLNATAGTVLRACDGTRSEAAIAAMLAAEYGIDIATAATDVAAVIADFRRLGLLEVEAD